MEQLQHVAIIMDGNGRWAKAHGKVRTQGHLVGVDNVRNIAIKANDMNIKVLTVYAFSTENWKRPLEEVDYLMKLPALFFNKFMKELMEKNIKITMIGEMEGIPQETAKVLQRAIDETANNTGMILNFAMNYGSRREITLAAKKYALDVLNDKAGLDIDEKEFERVITTTEANQNFSKVTKLVDELGTAVILKNNTPRYLVIDFSKADESAVAKNEDVLEISRRLLAQNKEAYEVLAE